MNEVSLDQPEFITVAAKLAEDWQKQAASGAEAQDKLLRTMAEWDNARKRLLREKEEAIKLANESLLESLLPIIDNFDLGMQAAGNAQDAKSIVIGLQMVLTQMKSFISEAGLEPIHAVGKPFDPHKHEALGYQESATHPDGTVISQTRAGYLLKGKLLRPAMVYVAKPVGSPASA